MRLERPWIPSGDGYSLYLRPTCIATWQHVGVSASKAFKLFVIACPVGPYYPEGAWRSRHAAPATTAGCDDFCQNLKKVFEARVGAFAGIRTAKGNDEVTVRLAGAKQCSVKEAPGSQSNGLGTQFVCYWQETSDSAAETRFRDLVSRLQILIPSNWSTHQGNELDDSTGAEITAWYAIEPGSKHDVRVYVSVESVGLHVTAWH